MCMAIYNDRVRSWELSLDLDNKVSTDPTYNNLNELVSLDERNRLAHLELEHYEKHETFLYKHPLLQDNRLMEELNRMRKTNPEAFMQEVAHTKQYISRYQSILNKKKYVDEEDKMKKQSLLARYTHKYQIMMEMLAKV